MRIYWPKPGALDGNWQKPPLEGRIEFRQMSAFGTKRTWISRQSMSALPRFSDIDLFGYCKRVVHLDP
jgi:hypothetical protein